MFTINQTLIRLDEDLLTCPPSVLTSRQYLSDVRPHPSKINKSSTGDGRPSRLSMFPSPGACKNLVYV